MPLQTKGQDAGFSALIMAAQQHQLMPPSSIVAPFSNDQSMGDGPLDGIVDSSSSMNPSPGTRLTDSTAYTVPSMGDSTSGLDNQLPYWTFGGDDFDNFSFVDTEGFGDLNISFLNAIGEYPLQPTLVETTEAVPDASLPPPIPESQHPHERTGPEKETAIQRSWYTYVGHVPSGYGTPEPLQAELQVDEDRRRDLTTRLQLPVQPGSLPSTSFLQWRQLPRLSSKEAFAAGTPTAWWKVMIKEAEARSSSLSRASAFYLSPERSVDVELPEIANEVDLYVQLERIGSTACESPDLSTGQESPAALEYQSLLLSWLSKYRTTRAFEVQEQSLMMLWHSIFIRMYSDLDMLELATGRDGPKAAKEAEEIVKSWARSPEAAR
ncbi:hypothetical protein LTR17_022372 [Elasticomyces elasticus]|nr:hypothetical protein LTR17_022372 [Elasticomyces elasticus]